MCSMWVILGVQILLKKNKINASVSFFEKQTELLTGPAQYF